MIASIQRNIEKLNQWALNDFKSFDASFEFICIIDGLHENHQTIIMMSPQRADIVDVDRLNLSGKIDGVRYVSTNTSHINYDVCALALQNTQIDSVKAVLASTHRISEDVIFYLLLICDRDFTPPQQFYETLGLFDCFIWDVFVTAYDHLFAPELNTKRLFEDVMVRAGRRLIKTVYQGPAHSPDFDLFEILKQVSQVRYEDFSSTGIIVFTDKAEDEKVITIRFEIPYFSANIKGFRKLVEISSESLCLVSNGYQIHGLTAWENVSQAFNVRFIDQGKWELCRGKHRLMFVNHGDVLLPRERLSETSFKLHLAHIFPSITPTDQDAIWKIVSVAMTQGRGTNLLITADAHREAQRLASQCTVVHPFLLTPDLAAQVTSIDGTVIIDERGYCHAISAILDGLVSLSGRRERGGRYNSAVMYFEQQIHPCVIVIVSQDGDIDILPPLHNLPS